MRTFAVALVLGIALPASFAACTSNENASNDAKRVDGGPADGGKADGSSVVDAGSACNTFTNGAAEATSSTVASAAPAPTGGTITEGTYHQTEFNLYEPGGTAKASSPSGLRATLIINGNVMNLVADFGDGEDRTFIEIFTTVGTALNRTLVCPKQGAGLDAVYSAAGRDLVVYETDPSSGLVAASVYVKQ